MSSCLGRRGGCGRQGRPALWWDARAPSVPGQTSLPLAVTVEDKLLFWEPGDLVPSWGGNHSGQVQLTLTGVIRPVGAESGQRRACPAPGPGPGAKRWFRSQTPVDTLTGAHTPGRQRRSTAYPHPGFWGAIRWPFCE